MLRPFWVQATLPFMAGAFFPFPLFPCREHEGPGNGPAAAPEPPANSAANAPRSPRKCCLAVVRERLFGENLFGVGGPFFAVKRGSFGPKWG